MRYYLSLVTGLGETLGHRFGALAILLWSDSHTMELPGTRRQLTQKRGESLFAKICGERLSIRLIFETTELHSPHAG